MCDDRSSPDIFFGFTSFHDQFVLLQIAIQFEHCICHCMCPVSLLVQHFYMGLMGGQRLYVKFPEVCMDLGSSSQTNSSPQCVVVPIVSVKWQGAHRSQTAGKESVCCCQICREPQGSVL